MRPGPKPSAKTLHIVDIVKANKQYPRPYVMEQIWEHYPEFTDHDFRQLIWVHEIHMGGRKIDPPPKEKPKPRRASVQSYSGRSRLLPGYYEL